MKYRRMKYMRMVLCLAALLLSGFTVLYAQSFSAKIRKVSIEDGLSNRFVREVFQDSKGFIWLGTNYGLNRYSGYDFQLFTKENEGFPTNRVHRIYEDADTCLWVRFLDGLSKSDGQRIVEDISFVNLNTLEVHNFKEQFGADFPIEQTDIFEVYQVAPQRIFLVTKSREVYEYESGKRCKLLFKMPYPNHTLGDIVASEEAIWVIGSGYILEYNAEGVLLQEELTPFKQILDIYEQDNRLMGFAHYLQGDSLFVFSKSPGRPVDYHAPHYTAPELSELNPFSHIYHAPNGLIWYSDMRYARMYNERGELIYDFSSRLKRQIVQSIFRIYFDNQNNVWIATTDGVYILTVQPNSFHTYLNRDEFVPNSEAYSTRGIVERNGYLYVNTYDGRRRINLLTEDVVSLESEESDWIYGLYPELDAIKDHQGNLWFSGHQNRIQRYTPETQELIDYPCKHVVPSDLLGNYHDRESYFKLYEDSRHRIWVGTANGVYYLDTVHQAFIKFNAHGACESLNENSVYALLEDPENNALWVGSLNGLYRYDYGQGVFIERYATDLEGADHLPEDNIFCLHKDKHQNVLWIGTKEGGLVKWNINTKSYEHFTVATGLSDNVIYGILEDESYCLWMSSNYGLMRFDKNTYWSTVYLPRDGITDGEFNTLSYYEADDGRFYFGSLNGIVAFYPSHFQQEEKTTTAIHVLEYERLSGNNKEMENCTEALMESGIISLDPDDVFFRLEFALLDFRNPEQNRYSYKIEGLGQGWQFISENELRINRLPYGNYTLRIRGQGIDGHWSSKELSIPLKVPAPFRHTLLFYLLIFFFFLCVGIIVMRIYVHKQQRAKILLEEQVANRTQKLREREQELLKAKEEAEKSSHAKAEFLSVMSHEIRTPMNAVVNLTNYLLEDSPPVRQIENLNTLKFSANNLLSIINDVLDFNKIESGKVEFEAIEFDLLNLLDSIRYSMAVNARKKGIDFAVEADFKPDHLLIGDPNRLTQILNNLLSNAIKFTEEGTVRLDVTLVDRAKDRLLLRFDVKDTGIGISDEEQTYIFNMFTQAASHTTRKYGGTGLGLAITRRLLQLQDSEIELESKVGEGSTFYFELAFKKGASLKTKRVLGAPVEKEKQELAGKRILVVEDNTINVLVVKRFLEKWGVLFTHASDGLVATQKATEQVFDLILMDIHMPNMDGYEAARVIRSHKEAYYREVPIIALTASALMDNRERVYEAGMNDIVVKPFKPAELYRILTQYIR